MSRPCVCDPAPLSALECGCGSDRRTRYEDRNQPGDVWADLIADIEAEYAEVKNTWGPHGLPGQFEMYERKIDMFRARREFGIQRYGRPLQRGNGRDVRQDATEEALDMLAYARQGRQIWLERIARDALDCCLYGWETAGPDVPE